MLLYPINAWVFYVKIYIHSRFIQSNTNNLHSNIRYRQCARRLATHTLFIVLCLWDVTISQSLNISFWAVLGFPKNLKKTGVRVRGRWCANNKSNLSQPCAWMWICHDFVKSCDKLTAQQSNPWDCWEESVLQSFKKLLSRSKPLNPNCCGWYARWPTVQIHGCEGCC